MAVTRLRVRSVGIFFSVLLCAGLLAGCQQRAPASPPVATPTADQLALAAQATFDAILSIATPGPAEAPVDVSPTPPAMHTPPATLTPPAATATSQTTPTTASTPAPDLFATATAQAAALATGVAATLAAHTAERLQAAQMATAVAATLTAQAPTATLTPRPTATARPVAVTPAQPRLAYAYGAVRNADIHIYTPADGRDRTVADRNCDEAEPGWAPGGARIFYHSDCAGTYDIYAVEVDTGVVQQLTGAACDEREPESSPDGRQVVYRRNCTPEAYNVDGELWVLNLADGSAASLGITGRAPAWSPDGARVAFMSDRGNGWEIYVYEFAGGAVRQLTGCAANCRFPAWSPDGRFVAYHATTGPATADAESIWIAPARGGEAQQLATGDRAGRATWSATGWVAFNSQNGIEMVNESGGQRRVLLSGDSHWAPAWSH